MHKLNVLKEAHKTILVKEDFISKNMGKRFFVENYQNYLHSLDESVN